MHNWSAGFYSYNSTVTSGLLLYMRMQMAHSQKQKDKLESTRTQVFCCVCSTIPQEVLRANEGYWRMLASTLQQYWDAPGMRPSNQTSNTCNWESRKEFVL